LVDAVLSFAQSNEPVYRRTAYLIISGVPNLFAGNQNSLISNIFAAGCQDADLEVQLAALKAAVYFMMTVSQPERKELSHLLPVMLNVCYFLI
jgi:hypothetical protein